MATPPSTFPHYGFGGKVGWVLRGGGDGGRGVKTGGGVLKPVTGSGVRMVLVEWVVTVLPDGAVVPLEGVVTGMGVAGLVLLPEI